ncbi:hypothetical protein [Nocardioides sp. R-C-SC26]|uniref:hypothetical protein n=1 Tax=Nocardioides sp. R-C-SC26 TaxID=2870414 RepID=UPI001E38BEB5|nr:hypothetical protein [Nocardioides sp. R-C-SC26]
MNSVLPRPSSPVIRIAACVLTLAVALVGCGGTDDDQDAAASPSAEQGVDDVVPELAPAQPTEGGTPLDGAQIDQGLADSLVALIGAEEATVEGRRIVAMMPGDSAGADDVCAVAMTAAGAVGAAAAVVLRYADRDVRC